VSGHEGIWAVVPVKEFEGAKQRLSACLTQEQRRALAACMLEDVLEALAAVGALGGIHVVTAEPAAAALARRYGAHVSTEGARSGHTGAVTAAARRLGAEGRAGMITMPGDIPAITAAEVSAALAAHKPAPSFTIVPAHDDLGSNAIICSPPDAVALRFGDDSFFPHLDAARHVGIEPTIVRLPGIAMDIDHPADLAAFLRMAPSRPTRTRRFLAEAKPAGL
jgi:2-phospho-L-lactate/phosphoenolpyruvate guanylyltransferase